MMPTFSVDITRLQTISSSFSSMNGSLKNLAQGVLNVQNHLDNGFPQKAQFVRALNRVEADILREAVAMNRLSQALGYICQRYTTSEKFIEGQMGFFEQIFHRVDTMISDVMRALGLEDLYNQLKYSYESYDRARTQEWLMDQYLQHECFELLEKEEYSEERWANATYEEREQIIRDFIRDVNETLDTRTDITVIFDDGEGNTAYNGWFDYKGDGKAEIYINPKRLRTGDYSVFKTCIHESRHCYQHAAVEHPERYIVSEETLRQWEENNKPGNYKEDEGYYEQPVEWDAFNFAEQYDRVDGVEPDYEGSWPADQN